MNIFVTSECPIQSAQYLDDKRVVKMALESAQMLSSCHHMVDGGTSEDIYALVHVNHPCSVWVRSSYSNYMWLYIHYKALLEEYSRRYNKQHASGCIATALEKPPSGLQDLGRTPFANCARNKSLGIDYTDYHDVHQAYIDYLDERWSKDKRVPTWYGKQRRKVDE